MRSLGVVLCLSLLSGTWLACESGGSGDESGTEGSSEELSRVEIPQLDLQIAASSDTTVRDGIGGNGAMVQAPGWVVTVQEPGQFHAATLEAAQENAQMYDPQNVTTETLEDGWVLSFENSGGMGTNYFVQVRREIDGTPYWCETTASSTQQAEAALAACKSLTR